MDSRTAIKSVGMGLLKSEMKNDLPDPKKNETDLYLGTPCLVVNTLHTSVRTATK